MILTLPTVDRCPQLRQYLTKRSIDDRFSKIATRQRFEHELGILGMIEATLNLVFRHRSWA